MKKEKEGSDFIPLWANPAVVDLTRNQNFLKKTISKVIDMEKYKTKDGRTIYELPKCQICGKTSNTTDKQTAANAKTYGRVCRDCKRNWRHLKNQKTESIITKWLNRLKKILGWFK